MISAPAMQPPAADPAEASLNTGLPPDPVTGIRETLIVVWAIARKDIRIALTERMSLLQSITLPVNYLIMMALFVLAGSNAPTAVVMLDHGMYAQQFVAAMEHAHTYRITIESQQQADAQMNAGTLVSEVVIPRNFDQAIAAHRPVSVWSMVNNLNEDLTYDAQRGMRLSEATFYEAMSPGQVPVTVTVSNQFASSTGYIPFLSLSIIVIALMVSGLLQGGNAAAREFEESTVTGLYLSPARPWQIFAGRMTGSFLVSLLGVAAVMTVVVFIVGDRPARLVLALAVALLTLAVFCAAGVALGTATKDRALVATLTRAIPVPLFFLSGVFGPLAWQTRAVQVIGEVLPVHWAVVLTQWAFKGFLTGPLPIAAEAGILAAYLGMFGAAAVAAIYLTARSRPSAPPARRRARARPPATAPGRAGKTAQETPAARPRPGSVEAVPLPRLAGWLSAALAICAKDLRVWIRQPWLVIGTLLVPVSYTLVAFLGAQSTSTEPVAVVNLDHGRVGTQITQAIIGTQDFRVTEATPAVARQMYDSQQLAAIITIPADASSLTARHQVVAVRVLNNNLNDDAQYDIDRGVPDAVISMYQSSPRPAGPMRVTLDGNTMRAQNVQLYQYSILPVIALVITVSGILVAGMSAAEEFERKTISVLLMSPAPRSVIIAGKMAAGWAFTCLTAVLVLGTGAALGWTRPYGAAGWAEVLAAIALGALFAAGAGIAIGTWGQRKQPVSVASTIVSVWLFALAGGLGVIFFEPQWLQDIARWDPLTYMIHALQQAVFYQTTAGVARDTLVLAAAIALSATAGTLAMRKGMR